MKQTPARARRLDMRPFAHWTALLAVGAAVIWAGVARADEPAMIKTHGYSFYGDLKYPADYTHFDYVNPDAPKGGEISIGLVGTFDSMNRYARKGNPDALANIGYESLLGDAPATNPFVSLPADVYGEAYGLLAERLEYPETKDWVIFYMRPEARFSDGTPVTAYDVEFSHNLFLDQGLKSYGDAVRKRIPKVEVIDDHTIKFYFTPGLSRRSLIDQAGGVPVMSKAWYEKTGARLDESSLEISPGSGPYIIDSVDVNRRVVYKRNPDYWGWDLPINQGRHNFDSIRLEYFTDPTASFEAFKAGVYTFRAEGSSKNWATGYDFPKVDSGAVVLEELPDGDIPTSSGFVFNLGSPTLQDKDVRIALGLAYNFQWSNESLQFGLFDQRTSFVQGTDLMATGKPEGAELAFLKSLGDVIPSYILEEEVPVPHVSKPERVADRRNLRRASKLLDGAGWTVGDDGLRRNAEGDKLTVNFLVSSSGSPTGRAIVENYTANMRVIGVDATLEAVDSAQFASRRRDRDYDMILGSYLDFREPDTNLEQMFGSEVASYSLFNPAGISDPGIDAIIAAALLSDSKEVESASMKALDRALRHQIAIVPVWYRSSHWVAFYDQYEHPEEIPPLDVGYLDYWWFNADKAAALRTSGALR